METKVRKNHLLRFASILFLFAMITNIAMTGTLAKYTASATGTSKANIAQFSVSVAGADIASSSSVTVNLFDTVKELTGGNVSETNESTADVSSQKIAPGTGGVFEISVVNNSDVKVTVTFSSVSESLNGVPIQYSTDNSNWTAAGTSLSSKISSQTVTIDAGDTGPVTLATIYWRWPFSVSSALDKDDTDLGVAGGQVSVTLTVSAVQVD